MDQINRDSFDTEIPLVPWENSLIQELQCLSPSSSASSICRVPKQLRSVNEKAYTPQTVSIGPFHHGKEDLKAMEEHKKRYLKDFIEWTNSSLRFYIEVVKEKEERLRACYQGGIGFNSEEFVKIILVDSAFIIVFLIKFSFSGPIDENDYIFNTPNMAAKVWMDMILLENQLPFFILVDFFGRVGVSFWHGEVPSILMLCQNFCIGRIDLEGMENKLGNIQSCEVAHFLDFVRCMIVPLDEHPSSKIEVVCAPSITELYQAGVKVKVGLGRNFDLQFHEGIFEITRFRLGPTEEILFCNLLAFEECFGGTNYISDYVVIMGELINTQDDVDLLVKHGILEKSKHTNKTMLSLMQELAAGAWYSSSSFYFAGLSKDLNTHCNKPWNKWKANLKQTYFSTPWTIISVIAAFVLLVLTLIQTVCSVISTKSSNSNGNQH